MRIPDQKFQTGSPKICVSVCGETADEVLERALAASADADAIEIRFDCLDSIVPGQLKAAVAKLRTSFGGWILATFRPANGGQGGARELSLPGRLAFWRTAAGFADWCDLEYDIAARDVETVRDGFKRTLRSFHDFGPSPDRRSLQTVYETLKSSVSGTRDVLKIAVRADDVCDAIPIWQLLGRSRAEGVPLIPIAMGEAGKWTRILGPGHGAFLTYASGESGRETAPGQISAADLKNVYRVGQLDENTAVYGLLAGDTTYSLSPYIHNAAFAGRGARAVFVPFQITDIEVFLRRFVRAATREVDLGFRGFAVTNPFKEAIIPHLDEIDATARAIGAVNTVSVRDGRLVGSNTDSEGFITPLRDRFGELAGLSAAVFGAGGAARACVSALVREGAQVTVFARNASRAEALAREFGCRAEDPRAGPAGPFGIVVNATPLGTAGELSALSAVPASALGGAKLAYDLVYNPPETRFLREAEAAGAATLGGLEMLVAQAAAQQRIWTGEKPPVEVMRGAAVAKLRNYEDRSA